MTLSRSLRRLALPATLALSGAILLPGCAPLVVGGAAATTAVVVSDRRTTGEQVEDQAIELKIANDMRTQFPDNARINAMSFAGHVLLTGDVPTQADSQRAQQLASQVEKVQRVTNRLRVGEVTPIGVRSNDTWLTSKVRTALINTKEVPSRTIVLTTERGIVYLMGRVTQDEAQRASKATAAVTGVNQVVTLFDIVSPESLPQAQRTDNSSATPSAAPTASTAAPAAPAASGDVQVMPIQ